MTFSRDATRPTRATRRISPALALLLIAPVIGELISGHQAPLDFINPLSWVLTAAPYGLGALLCREVAVRWGGGWWRVMVLAIAYGLVEEGLVARSFFDPQWSELGALADYNHVGGINWTYSATLLHFHVTISILASIAVAEMLFPTRRGERWLDTRRMVLAGIGLALWAPALMGVQRAIPEPDFPFFFPPIGYYLGTVAAIAGVVWVARLLPAPRLGDARRSLPRVARPGVFFLIGLLDTTLIFVGTFLVPEWTDPPPLVASVLFLIVVDGVAVALIALSGNLTAWSDLHILALVAGHLTFFLVFGVLQDIDDGFTGKTFVAIAGGLALLAVRRRVRARAHAD